MRGRAGAAAVTGRTNGAGTAYDGLLLGLGTLTVMPVPPPRTVDRRSAGWAMTLAPVLALALALPAVLLLALLGTRPASPLLSAALTVGLIALLTRGLHLDGLADTADGLGSGRPAREALEAMRRSDIGPFGVVTLVLVLLLQVAALAAQVGAGHGAVTVTFALLVSRLTLPLVCSRGVPAARPDGLGRVVSDSVSRAQLALAVAVAGGLGLVLVLVAAGTPGTPLARTLATSLVAGVAGVAAAAGTCWWCVRRLGGVTGDVLGACVEVAFTTVLVVLAAL